jgi:hypothetical protein
LVLEALGLQIKQQKLKALGGRHICFARNFVTSLAVLVHYATHNGETISMFKNTACGW